jgi:hypothetical protein
MADGTTTNYSFTLPEVGASTDTWGTKLNANWTLADSTIGNIVDGTTAIAPNLTEGSWQVGGTAVTATAAELNLLDGATGGIGKMLQLVHGVKASDTTVSNTTLTDLSLSAAITPSSTSHKVLIIANVKTYHRQIDDSGVELALYIDGTNTIEWSHDFYSASSSVDGAGLGGMATLVYLHSPATTSEVTYSVYGRNAFTGFAEFHGTESTITAMEIVA